jgi:CheY-like chemotaxis protein
MQGPTILIANSDPNNTTNLSEVLRQHARSVLVVGSPEELLAAVPKHRATTVIADLETVPLSEIERLHKTFRQLSIICTHRVPDEQMWADSLAAGAIDCCHNRDLNGIARAATGRRYKVQAA